MKYILFLVIAILTPLSTLARAEDHEREVRLSPDGLHFVGWYDHNAGLPFGVVRPIMLRSVSGQYDIFSIVSVPRSTSAAWNSASTMCVIADAPDNGGPNTWLVQRKEDELWDTIKLDPFKELCAEYSKTSHGAELWRPSILKIKWISVTTVSFYSYCNLGTYLITIDTTATDKKPVIKKLSAELQEPKEE